MDLRKQNDIYIEIPLMIILIYYFYNKEKHSKFELLLYAIVTIVLFINIILSLELVKIRFVSWNYFLTE
jgi:hypothetical protein|tara:strand:+ start:855 stop:1061 length:207 start_codon:yes stop_codon:yes gene_type:complete